MAEGSGPERTAMRPESTIVQSFSADLDNMFGLNESVGQLEQNVEAKKQNVSISHQQLQELEAKLRATEERLAKVSRGNSPARPFDHTDTTGGVEERSQAGSAASKGTSSTLQPPTSRPAQRQSAANRPQEVREETQALMAGMPGAMPQTPKELGANSDYVIVDRNAGR